MKARVLDIDPDAAASATPRVGAAPTATVILPMHNASAHVARALELAGRLENVDYELIVVDDGSNDDTWSLLVAADYPVPATLIRLRRNAGVARARNIALRAAAGRYVWMIDGDDAWPSNALETLVGAAERTGAGLVVASAEKIITATGERMPVTVPKRTGDYTQKEMLLELLDGGLRGHLWNKLFRRERLPIDPFPVMRSKSDYCMIIDALPAIGDMHVTSASVYEYRYQLGSITNSRTATPLDLLRCYEAAMRAVDAVDWQEAPTRSMERFRYFSIAQIVMSEVWRFGTRAVNAREARDYVRGILTVRGLVSLARAVGPRQLTLAAGLKFAPDVVGALYRRRRGKRWTQTS